MKPTDPDIVGKKLVKILDETIEHSEWHTSAFLKNILKELEGLRDYVVRELKALSDVEKITYHPEHAQPVKNIQQEKKGYTLAYISLYQSETELLDRWFVAILALSKYGVSRPAYASEAAIQNMIRCKAGQSDGYLVIWVKESDVLPATPSQPLQKDNWGNELMSLKEGFFDMDNVVKFVLNAKDYRVTEESLIPMD